MTEEYDTLKAQLAEAREQYIQHERYAQANYRSFALLLDQVRGENAALRAQIEAMTRLRPMSEAPDPKLDEVFLYRKDSETGLIYAVTTASYVRLQQKWFYHSGWIEDASEYVGWLPIPTAEAGE